MTPRRLLAAAPQALTPMAVLAVLLAILLPSGTVAGDADLLLALLVIVTALGIPARQLTALRRHAAAVAVLSIAPLVVLGAAGWLLGRAFSEPVRDGLLALGVSSSEVASVGLVALAGADAAVALAVVTGSLVLSALLGPVALGLLAGPGPGHALGHGGTGHLLVRFALVVIVPLIVGVAVRSAAPRLSAVDEEREGVAAIAVAALVYAALSGAHHVGSALIAALLFLAVSAILAEFWRRAAPALKVPGAFTIGMRDFAVAAALASQAFGNRAAAVAGVYGVAMLLAGSVAARAVSSRA